MGDLEVVAEGSPGWIATSSAITEATLHLPTFHLLPRSDKLPGAPIWVYYMRYHRPLRRLSFPVFQARRWPIALLCRNDHQDAEGFPPVNSWFRWSSGIPYAQRLSSLGRTNSDRGI